MRKCFIFLCLTFLVSSPVFADITQMTAINQLTSPQNINFEDCTKIFGVNQEKLFYLTLASITANRFNIDESQSADGYIMFSVNRNKYLATIAKVCNNSAKNE